MTTKKANKLIDDILKENSIEVGIFISMVSYEYMKKYNIDDKHFLNSLKNSLKILESKGE